MTDDGFFVAGTTEEVWRDIDGFFGYEVSSLGVVRSWHRRGRGMSDKPTPLKQTDCGSGHLRVKMYPRRGAIRSVLTHVIVAEHFICKRPDGLVCDHINGIKTDNRPENLRWVTQKENVRAAIRSGAFKPRINSGLAASVVARRKLTDDDIRSIFEMSQSGITGREIARRMGVSPTHVCNILSGKDARGAAEKANFPSAPE